MSAATREILNIACTLSRVSPSIWQMRNWCVAAMAAGVLHAAVIRGVVVENQSGRPITRALVVVQPVSGTPGTVQSIRTNPYGAFEFPALDAGAYLVSATRRSFAPMQFGQKRWKSSGVPVRIEAGEIAITIRMQHYGGIAGTVADENDVGFPEYEVVLYRNTRPPQLIAKAQTDDRGVYRIGGLEPGSYLVRALAKQFEDITYLPTFSRETLRIDEARPTEVLLDQTTDQVNIRPSPGRLYPLEGRVMPPAAATVTLVSDTGIITTVAAPDGNFKFDLLPPARYELNAQATTRSGAQYGWMPLTLDRGRQVPDFQLGGPTELRIAVEDTAGRAIDPQSVSILARRKELYGDAKPQPVRLAQGRTTLLPGRWDLALMPGTAHYVAAFSVHRERADGWNEVAIQGPDPTEVKFTLSSNPGAIHGAVPGGIGAPVFLEPYDARAKKRLGDVRSTRTDLHGQYQFYGLAPGEYRLLSSFDFDAPDADAMAAAGAKVIAVEEGRDVTADLELFVLR